MSPEIQTLQIALAIGRAQQAQKASCSEGAARLGVIENAKFRADAEAYLNRVA